MSNNWSEEELDATVKIYCEMKILSSTGQKYIKTRYYEKLHKQFGRSIKAYGRRMSNISHVYSTMGREWVPGLKPQRNVGSNVIEILEKLIKKYDQNAWDNRVTFDREVSELRNNKKLKKPPGAKKPKQSNESRTIYKRDPNVTAWVLNNSMGTCECCNKTAPFIKVDDNYYLEVHHLKRLADNGSDTTTNAVAVCPNCHKELHYGKNKELLLDKMYSSNGRVIKE